MTAVAPALAASSTPSGNGKKASEATTAPCSGDCAFITASLTESTRLIWPAPTPRGAPSRAKTMALDFTCLQTFQAKRMFCISSGEGARLVTVRSSDSALSPGAGGCTRMRQASGFEIDKIVVGKLFALKLIGCGQSLQGEADRNVESGGLVRIFTIAEFLLAANSKVEALRENWLFAERDLMGGNGEPLEFGGD